MRAREKAFSRLERRGESLSWRQSIGWRVASALALGEEIARGIGLSGTGSAQPRGELARDERVRRDLAHRREMLPQRALETAVRLAPSGGGVGIGGAQLLDDRQRLRPYG
jgi:hypothetical protein